MEKFTYKDYLKYKKIIKTQYQVNEETTEYELPKGEIVHQDKDKLVKQILSDKKEFIKFIERYLGNEEFGKLSENDIEKYDKEFITSDFRKKESDIVYKIAKKNFYILVEHQSRIDYSMPRRMTRYCIELIDSLNKNTKKEIYPVIYPIVLYTGIKKWNVETTIKEEEQNRYGTEPLNYPKYELVEINDYTKEELIQESTAMSKLLLFEKLKPEELTEVLEKLTKKELTTEEKKCISMIFLYSNKIRNLLSKDNKYVEKIVKGEVENMRFEETFLQALKLNREEGERQGRQDGEKRGEARGEARGEKIGIAKAITQMVKEMIKKQMNDDDIMEITRIDKEELERLKMA